RDPQCRRHARHRHSRPALSLLPEDPRAAARIRLLGPARSGIQLPDRRDALCDLSQPGRVALRRRDREGLLLGAQHRRPPVPDLRDQLRAPRLPGPLVPAIESVHVSLPRRRLLCRRLPCLRSSRARPVRISVQGRGRHPLHRGRRNAHPRWCPGDAVGPEVVVRLIERVGRWFDARVQLANTAKGVLSHPVPRQTASWFYVFGSAALIVFVLQIVTGILLALIYVPSAGEAWGTLHNLNQHVSAGWFIRALHGWGSNFMVAILLIHMKRFDCGNQRTGQPRCAQLIAKIWNCRPSMLRTQQETFAVSPSEGDSIGLRKVAKRVSPVGKLDTGPSGTQETYPRRRSRIFGEKR